MDEYFRFDRYLRNTNIQLLLIERGIFLSHTALNNSYYHYHSGSGQLPTVLFADERLLAHIGVPTSDPLPLKPVSPPPFATQRRPSNVLLDIIGILQAIADQGGIKLTKAGALQVNSARKLTKAQKWQETGMTVDGFVLPDPAMAFTNALKHSNLLAIDSNDTLVLQQSLAQFAARSDVEQVAALLQGIVRTVEWTEWETSSWVNKSRYVEGRQILLLALKMLPVRDWVTVDELEQVLFDRVGEHFSRQNILMQPRQLNNDQSAYQQALENWRTTLRQNWLAKERFWIGYTLSTWLYYLGLVELGLDSNAATMPTPENSTTATPAAPTRVTQNDTVVSFRLTELGQAVLHPEQSDISPVSPPQPAWIVQPNFEVMVYLEEVALPQLAFLEQHAERLDVQQHMAQYRLTRDSIYRGLEGGSSLDKLLHGLQAGAKVPLPQNVEIDLRQWGELREQVIVRRQSRLLEFPNAETCQSAIAAGLRGTVIGDRFVLLSPLETGKQWIQSEVDYDEPLPKCLSIDESGVARLSASTDLLIESQLNKWMEKSPDGWKLTRSSVATAMKSGKIGELFELLEERLTHKLPPLLEVAIESWAGITPTVEMKTVLVLRCTHPTVFQAIASSKRFKPYLLGKLAPDVFIVDGRQLENLQKELAWVGFDISDKLDLS